MCYAFEFKGDTYIVLKHFKRANELLWTVDNLVSATDELSDEACNFIKSVAQRLVIGSDELLSGVKSNSDYVDLGCKLIQAYEYTKETGVNYGLLD